MLRIGPLRGGVAMLLAQNLILMGIFFTIPLYLQIVQGLDALETGMRMLPASVGLFVSALVGSALASRFAPRADGPRRARPRLRLLADAAGTVEPELDNTSFLVAMGVLGVGMGLVVSQLGNVVQSAIGDEQRSEAGGLQNTAQQLGSSLGTALLGAIVITGLIAAFTANIAADPQVTARVEQQVEVQLSAGASFVASDQVREARAGGRGDPRTTDALVGRLRRRPAERAEDRLPRRRPARPRVLLVDPTAAGGTANCLI